MSGAGPGGGTGQAGGLRDAPAEGEPPAWLDRDEYPFRSRYLELPMGRMHYVDEGESDHAVVMVHGNPAWSFAWRKLIKCLSERYRCIAIDHIGFGLSDKPPDWDYLPESHAANLEVLIDHLGLRSVTFVVADWGGPIGLSCAIAHAQRVKSLVITNTWMWPVKGDLHYEGFSRFMGGRIGKVLILRYNFFVQVLMKRMFRAGLDAATHRHYLEPLGRPEDRVGCWVFPKRILGSTPWLADLWARREAIADKPALILWGSKDIAFRHRELDRWRSLFADAQVHELEAGHFVAEELGVELCPTVLGHLDAVAG